MAEALDVGVMLGFDHNAGEGLGAGVTQDDASVLAKGGFSLGEGLGDLWDGLQRRLGTDFHVDDGLGVVLEADDEML